MNYINWKKNEIVKFMVANDLKFVVYRGMILFNKCDYKTVRAFMDENKELGIPVFTNIPICKILISRV